MSPDRHRRPAVVYLVDDEPMVTGAIAAFLELETDHLVHRFESGAAALEAMAAAPPDLVVSDFLMPGMNGLEFLAEVRRRDPDIPRIMLTGYADKENAIRGINEVELFQYLEKPLDNRQLLLVLGNALGRRSLQEALQGKIRELDRTVRQRDVLSARDEEVRKELAYARSVQEKFLPDGVPVVPGFALEAAYHPSMDVGGDYYDFVPLAGGRLAVVVADGAGHGVQAALGTALLRFAAAGLAGRDLGPAGILAAMNEVIFAGLPREIPVAAGAAVLTPDSPRVLLAGAGLPKPLRIGPTGAVTHEPATGLLLGLVDGDMYTAGTEIAVDLEPGESVLLLSDGLTEAQDAGGDFYGEGPLDVDAAELAGGDRSRLGAALAERALAFGRDGDRDDLTIVTITRG